MASASTLPVEWHKSSYSTNGGNCVEVGTWRKSTYSSTNGGNCVEVGEGVPDAVPVRDSKDPHGPALLFTPAAWRTFLTHVKSGAYPTS